MGSLRWGILGTGGIAHAFTSDLVGHGFTVTAVGSRSQVGAERFASVFGIEHAHASYESLVADDAVDAVYIATPHPVHAENTLLALNAGRHVLVEKPFALNAAQARAMVSRAQSGGQVILEAMWTRFLPHMVRIRELIASGAIGDVHTLLADHNQRLSNDPLGRIRNPELGGGALLDLGIYPISLAWDLFGAPDRILASASMTETGVDRQTGIILAYRGGAHAVLQTALDTRGPNGASIIGTAGRIDIDAVWYMTTSFTVFDSAGNAVERWDEPVTGRGMQFQAWELERLVAEGSSDNDVLPPAESIAIMETLDEIRRQIGLVYPQESTGVAQA